MVVSNSVGLYLVLFAVVMGVAAIVALLIGGRAQSSSAPGPERDAETTSDVPGAEAVEIPPV